MCWSVVGAVLRSGCGECLEDQGRCKVVKQATDLRGCGREKACVRRQIGVAALIDRPSGHCDLCGSRVPTMQVETGAAARGSSLRLPLAMAAGQTPRNADFAVALDFVPTGQLIRRQQVHPILSADDVAPSDPFGSDDEHAEFSLFPTRSWRAGIPEVVVLDTDVVSALLPRVGDEPAS